MSAIRPLERFDVENEREERLRVERELQRRHEKGQDLELGFGDAPFGLIFSDANGVRVSIALDGSGNLTATNVDTGSAVTLVAYDDIGGTPDSLADINSTEFEELLNLRTDLGTTQAAIVAEASVRESADSAQATLIETTEASLRTEADRINLLPAQYQLFAFSDLPAFQFIQASSAEDGRDHIFRRGNQPARFDQELAAQTFLTARFHGTSGEANMSLPPGKYGFKCAVLGGGFITDFRVRLRDASGAQAQETIFLSTGVDGQLLEGVWDLSSATVSDYYFEITCATSTSGVGSWIPYRFQLTALPDDATEAGDWVSPGLNAAVQVLRGAFVGVDGRVIAGIRLVADAGGGAPKSIEIFDTETGGGVRIVGDTEIAGNLLVDGTITGAKILGNEITNRSRQVDDGDVAFTNAWTTISDITIPVDGGSVSILSQATIIAATGPAGGVVIVEARLVRSGGASTVFLKEFEVGRSAPDTRYDSELGQNAAQPTIYSGVVTIIEEDDPPGETERYRVQLRTLSSEHTGIARDRVLTCREFKTEE